MVQVAHMEDKMEVAWDIFGVSYIDFLDTSVHRCDNVMIEGYKRGWVVPKITSRKVVLKDLRYLRINET